jgi:hypothetical protein
MTSSGFEPSSLWHSSSTSYATACPQQIEDNKWKLINSCFVFETLSSMNNLPIKSPCIGMWSVVECGTSTHSGGSLLPDCIGIGMWWAWAHQVTRLVVHVLIKYRTMKMYEDWRASCIFNLSRGWRWVVSFIFWLLWYNWKAGGQVL